MSIKLTPKQLAEQETERLAEQQSSNAQNRKNYLDSLAKKKEAAEKEREIIRAKEAQNLKDELRASYMTANKSATPEMFEKAYPSLRDELFKANALQALQLDKDSPEYQM